MASQIQKIVLSKDLNGAITYGLPPAIEVGNYRTTLAANTAQTLTVPTGATCVIYSFSLGGNVFVKEGGSSIALPGGSFALDESELNPVSRTCTPGATLRFISDDINYVVVRFFNGNR